MNAEVVIVVLMGIALVASGAALVYSVVRLRKALRENKEKQDVTTRIIDQTRINFLNAKRDREPMPDGLVTPMLMGEDISDK